MNLIVYKTSNIIKEYKIMLPIIIISILFKESISPLPNEDEILDYYSSIKTNYSALIFNSSFFNINNRIYITLKSLNICENYMGFQFFDDINSIFNSTFDSITHITSSMKLDDNLIKEKKYFTQEFHIDKRLEYLNLNKIKGDFLYLEFKCRSEVEVINNKYSIGIIYIGPLFFFVIISLGIFLVIIIKGIICCLITLKMVESKAKKIQRKYVMNKIRKMNENDYQNNLFYPAKEIIVSQGRYIYIFPQNSLVNNNDNYQNNYNYNNFIYENEKNEIYPQIQISE